MAQRRGTEERAERKRGQEGGVCGALKHSIRVRILEVLNEGPMSPSQFVDQGLVPDELHKSYHQALALASYHFRELEKAGCVKTIETIPRRGATEHVYEGLARVYFTDEEFAQLSIESRERLSRLAFQALIARTDSAMQAGTFDGRIDRHLTWMPFMGKVSMRRHYRFAAIAVSMLAANVAAMMLMVGIASGSGRPPEAHIRSSIASFPLWKSVPSGTFAVLGRGVLHGGKWEVFASPESSRDRRREPCLIVARIASDFRFGSAAGCGLPAPLNGPHHPPVNPLYTESIIRRSGGRAIEASYTALSVAQNISRVELGLVPGPNVVRDTKMLSAAQARKSHLDRFRYLALALPRVVCISSISGFDALGVEVFSAAMDECDGASY
jgi:hypothetical protein